MRTSALLIVLFLSPLPCLAQVSTNSSALDTLAPAGKPAATATAVHKRASVHHSGHTVHAAHAAQRLPAVPIPAAAPANPVIPPPPFVMPAHKTPPPPPVSVKADATGTATRIDGSMRITFGTASADLNPGTLAALQKIAADAKANAAMQINVTAWAPGTAEDPSTPRRLSLDRALAARAVLINAGIVSDRIHAIAKGFEGAGTAAPDRVDVAEVLPPAAASTPAGKP
jgi:outer membrane protein OmpA-like peptidoglycan-associated protein